MSKFRTAVFCLILLGAPLALAEGTYIQIDYPGATLTIAYGINRTGEIVGTYNDSTGFTHGFLLSDGTFTTIDYPGASLSVAAGINDAGVIAGQFNDSLGHGHGFLYSKGKYNRLPDDGKVYNTSPVSISDKGLIAGFTLSAPGAKGLYSGFESVSKTYAPVNFPGANFSVALGINPGGDHIVGSYNLNFPTGTALGFLYRGGSFTTIQIRGSTGTQAFGINDSGTIVGDYFVSGSSNSQGFLLKGTRFLTINFPGAMQSFPSNLNDFNEVVGWFIDSAGATHGYLITGV
jgi:probable HAF family extracellular repeat protein